MSWLSQDIKFLYAKVLGIEHSALDWFETVALPQIKTAGSAAALKLVPIAEAAAAAAVTGTLTSAGKNDALKQAETIVETAAAGAGVAIATQAISAAAGAVEAAATGAAGQHGNAGVSAPAAAQPAS